MHNHLNHNTAVLLPFTMSPPSPLFNNLEATQSHQRAEKRVCFPVQIQYVKFNLQVDICIHGVTCCQYSIHCGQGKLLRQSF